MKEGKKKKRKKHGNKYGNTFSAAHEQIRQMSAKRACDKIGNNLKMNEEKKYTFAGTA